MSDHKTASHMLSVMQIAFEQIEDPVVAVDAAIAALVILLEDVPDAGPALLGGAGRLLAHLEAARG